VVRVSQAHNRPARITGALIATRDHFAQILEGPDAAVTALMDRIARDGRHSDVSVLNDMAIEDRLFAQWSMAYSGPSTYVARAIEPLIRASDLRGQAAAIARLTELMRGLAAS